MSLGSMGITGGLPQRTQNRDRHNLVENAIRPTALGKKNWLFFGDADAGERSAIIYSIIESCRRHGIEPYTYLHDVLKRLPSMTNRRIKDVVRKAWQLSLSGFGDLSNDSPVCFPVA
jgi:IS66 C-terminal element/Transposase IS66 family